MPDAPRARAWILNLDAEHELEAGSRYAPTKNLRAIMAREAPRLRGVLVGEGDLVLDPDLIEPGCARGMQGLAWSPTPRARAALERAGAELASAPSLEVLRAVNERAFAARVRAELGVDSFEKHIVRTLVEVLEALARSTPNGWLVRRPFGAAGRGRRRIAVGAPDASELAWLEASLARGALVVEPWVAITREYTRSGEVDQDGGVRVLPPCFQATTREGAWIETVAGSLAEVGKQDDAALERAAHRAGAALSAAGYFGPYGIDAFRHLDPESGSEVLNPLSEINARFTMDWTAAAPGPFPA